MKERSTRACQACRLRKVKCSGDSEHDCSHCRRLGLKCVYPETNPVSRLRRSTVRGSIIRSCLDPAAHHQSETNCEKSSLPCPIPLDRSISHDVDAKIFFDLIPGYCEYVLPTFPVVSETALKTAIGRMNESLDDYVLVHSLAAATVVHQNLAEVPSDQGLVRSLYTETLNARRHLTSPPCITVESVMTSSFLAKSFADAEGDGKLCYYYLRDAITRLQLLRVDDQHSQAQQTPIEARQRERVYWLLFIHERFDALSNFRPTVLSPLPNFPEYDNSIPVLVHIGFIRLIELFQMIDPKFIQYRLDIANSSITIDWIRQKQAELGSDIETWEEDISSLSLVQQVDLGVTRHWLRALVWQMSLQMFSVFTEGRAEEDYMSILFPIQLSQKLRSLLAHIPRQAVEVHSTGIVHKIFEIAAVSADVLEHVVARMHDPSQHSDYIDNFVFLSNFCLSMPRFNERAQLELRFHKIRSLFPWYFEGVEHVVVT